MTGNSRFRPVVVARFAERSKLSCKFISVRKVVKIRFLYSSDRRSRPYATTVSLFAVVLTQSAISACRDGVVLPIAISRRNSEQSCSTVVRKCWTQRTSVSSSCGTGSWHQHKLAELDMVADIPTLYPFHKQGPYQSTGRTESAACTVQRPNSQGIAVLCPAFSRKVSPLRGTRRHRL